VNQNGKRNLLLVIAATMIAALIVALLAIPLTAGAQGPTATLAPTAPPTTPTLDPQTILDAANKASSDADRAANSVNLILSFIQVAGLIGGVLAALLAAAGARTIAEYRGELNAAREELDKMRQRLMAETEEIRAQGDRAIRALAMMQLGEQQLEAKNKKAALDIYQQAYDLDPNNRATNYFLGELYIQERDLSKGIEHLERALADGDYAPAEAALAYAVELQGDRATETNERNRLYAQAEAGFLKALKTDPAVRDINGESVYGVLGGLYKRQRRIEDAIRCYQEAERVTPPNSYPVNNLAMLYFQQGKQDIADAYFKRSATMSARILDGNPFDYWARFDLTEALLAQDNADEAKKQLEIALNQTQNARPLEIFLGDLNRLKESPYPPPEVDHFIAAVQQAISKLRG
jgi:tetratricopeptide (TPR) repeat protein